MLNYNHLTDDELLALVYAEHASNALAQELAKRLEKAQDDLDVLHATLND
jgi:hypothetical protein